MISITGKIRSRIVLAAFAAIFLSAISTSCQKDEGSSGSISEDSKTVLVYMAGDNSLSSYVEANMSQMESGMKSINDKTKRLLALADDGSSSTKLYEITYKGRKVVKNYNTNLNTADPEVFKQVFNDVRTLAPAAGYGLVMWSHGTGWLPYDTTYPLLKSFEQQEQPQYPDAPFAVRPSPGALFHTKAFSQDGNRSMTTDQLASALTSDIKFDYIIFDACYMSSIELLYALRNKASYIVASPTEIMASGFPYADICSQLLSAPSKTLAAMESVCASYFQYYNRQSGSFQSAAIALINTAALDALVMKVRELGLSTSGVDPNAVQRFNRQYNFPCFDFTDTYKTANNGSVSWQNELNNVVLVKYNTPTFIDLTINTCSGISTYIPLVEAPLTNAAYTNTEWYKNTR